MKTVLIIPRHSYGLLTLDGATRLTIALSPDGAAALDRLTTCSKSAVADDAIQILDAIANAPAHDCARFVTSRLFIAVKHEPDLQMVLSQLAKKFRRIAHELDVMSIS